MRHTPLYVRLAEQILQEISDGRLRPGDKLPTEEELSRLHSVSRITAREGLNMLRYRGLVERFPRRGSFVSKSPPIGVWIVSSFEDFVRLGTETETKILQWKEINPPPQVQQLLRVTGQPVYRLRGIRTRNGRPLHYVEIYTLLRLGQRLHREDFVHRTVVDLIETKLGVPVVDASEEISAGPADRSLARRLGVSVGAPVVIQDLIYFGLDGHPLECLRVWWRADQFKRRNRLARSGSIEKSRIDRSTAERPAAPPTPPTSSLSIRIGGGSMPASLGVRK